MKKMLFLVFLTLFFGPVSAQTTYVMHYLPTLNYEQARAYAGYDMIIVDHEVINTSANWLRYMRVNNPGLKIFVYSEKMQWHSPMFPDKPWSLKMVAEFKKYPRWFLYNPYGKNLHFWPGTTMMNCRLDGPRYLIDGKSYSYIEYFTKRYIRDIIGTYQKEGIKLNGILDDDLLKDISFLEGGVDSNLDGKEDDPSELNRQWRLGNAYFLNKVREAMGKDFIIIGNGGHGYYMDHCTGKQMENFPETFIGDWYQNMTNASGMKLALFNARKDNWLFTICSSMLKDNIWFSQEQNTSYDQKYNLQLGNPVSTYYQEENGFARKFQNGIVHVNPSTEKAWIER
jgi:Hypothetical glycosyl hydrolase family 15